MHDVSSLFLSLLPDSEKSNLFSLSLSNTIREPTRADFTLFIIDSVIVGLYSLD